MRRAGIAGAKNNTRGVLDRTGTQLLRLRPTLSPQAVGKGSAAWSSAPLSRLIGCSFLCSYGAVALSSRPRRQTHIHPTHPQSQHPAILHHRAFDLRNPAPPPFSPAEPPKTLPEQVS